MYFLLVLFYRPTHICFSSSSSITSLRLCPSVRRVFPSTTANSRFPWSCLFFLYLLFFCAYTHSPSRLSLDSGKQLFGFPDSVFLSPPAGFLRLCPSGCRTFSWTATDGLVSLFPCIAYCFSIAMPHPVFTFPPGAVDSYRFSIRQAPV